MAERFTIELTEEKAQRMREIARLAGVLVESVISEMAEVQVASRETIDTQLEDVHSFSNIRLWSIVAGGLGFPESLDKRMLALIKKSKDSIITGIEQKELDELVVVYDKFVLLRTEALVELQERGYDIKGYLKENAPVS